MDILSSFQTSHGGNVSSSMVRLTPNASDDGRLLSCRAENRNLPTAVIEDTWKLSVYCKYAADIALVLYYLRKTFKTLNVCINHYKKRRKEEKRCSESIS